MRRRQYIALGGTVIVVSTAGCVGGADEPDPDAPAEDMLPEDGDGWELTDTADQDASLVGAQDGIQGSYAYDGDGYTVEVLRWGSNADAEDGAEDVYGDWTRSLAHGVFSFAADGPEGQRCEELLARSPPLDAGMF